jgi:hypothetical protein
MSLDLWISRGEALARQCAGGGVTESQIAQLLAHLKRNQNLASTRALLDRLPTSPFGTRTGSTRKQYEALTKHVGPALRRAATWQEAAQILGWAKRLMPLHGGGRR